MKRNGFTLTELLLALLILSFISGIAIFAITKIVEKSKDKSFETYENTMHTIAMELMLDAINNPNSDYSFPRNHETIKLYLADMINKKEIDSFINPRNKNDYCINDDSYIEIAREDYKEGTNNTSKAQIDVLEYKVCLKCIESSYDNCIIFPRIASPDN